MRKRNRQIKIWLSEEEYKILKEKQEKENFNSITDYIMYLITHKKKYKKISVDYSVLEKILKENEIDIVKLVDILNNKF